MIYLVCTIPVPDQSALVQGQCPHTCPAFSRGNVVAVPIDSSGKPGHTLGCDLGDNCGGVIVPRRHRR